MRYPANVFTLDTDEFSMDYAVFGKGEKKLVILPGISLHSVMDSAGAVASAYSRFATEYTFYIFERKHGLTEDYGVSEMADDTAKAMKALGISGAYVFGASQGGMTAQIIAARYPELVKKAALVSACCEICEHSAKMFKRTAKLIKQKRVAQMNREFFEAIYSPEHIKKYEQAFKALENLGTDSELDNFYCEVLACLGFNSENEAKKISCPVLVIADRDDRFIPFTESEKLAKLCNAELYLYSGYGHAVYDEADDFIDRMMHFFSK